MDFEFENESFQQRFSSPELLQGMKIIWLNERSAPELLPFAQEIFEPLYLFLQQQEEVVNQNSKTEDVLILNLIQMECDRVRYILSDYLRVRLRKIEKYFLFYNEASERTKLFTAEAKYLENYVELVGNHINEFFLKHLSVPMFNNLDKLKTRPDLKSYVCCLVSQNIGNFQLEENEVNLQKGDAWLLPYQVTQSFLQNNKIQLL